MSQSCRKIDLVKLVSHNTTTIKTDSEEKEYSEDEDKINLIIEKENQRKLNLVFIPAF